MNKQEFKVKRVETLGERNDVELKNPKGDRLYIFIKKEKMMAVGYGTGSYRNTGYSILYQLNSLTNRWKQQFANFYTQKKEIGKTILTKKEILSLGKEYEQLALQAIEKGRTENDK